VSKLNISFVIHILCATENIWKHKTLIILKKTKSIHNNTTNNKVIKTNTKTILNI